MHCPVRHMDGVMNKRYETQATGLRILPGQWRPHYPWEHIAWVSPPWASQDYVWLDFPEAICSSLGFLYLSHVNPPIPTIFKDLPALLVTIRLFPLGETEIRS